MKSVFLVSVLVGSSMLSGCASLGLGESSSYACKAPDGVSCKSVSGIYSNAVQNNLPGQKLDKGEDLSLEQSGFKPIGSTVISSGEAKDIPLLTKSKTMEVKVYPWEDKDGVLHGKSEFYIVVKEPEWSVPHTTEKKETPSFGSMFGFNGSK